MGKIKECWFFICVAMAAVIEEMNGSSHGKRLVSPKSENEEQEVRRITLFDWIVGWNIYIYIYLYYLPLVHLLILDAREIKIAALYQNYQDFDHKYNITTLERWENKVPKILFYLARFKPKVYWSLYLQYVAKFAKGISVSSCKIGTKN